MMLSDSISDKSPILLELLLVSLYTLGVIYRVSSLQEIAPFHLSSVRVFKVKLACENDNVACQV